MSRWRDPQLQVSENYSDWTKSLFSNLSGWCHILSLTYLKCGTLCANKKWKPGYMRHRRLKGQYLYGRWWKCLLPSVLSRWPGDIPNDAMLSQMTSFPPSLHHVGMFSHVVTPPYILYTACLTKENRIWFYFPWSHVQIPCNLVKTKGNIVTWYNSRHWHMCGI